VKLHLWLPYTILGYFLALRSTSALFTPAMDVCGKIVAPSSDGKVLINVGTYQTGPMAEPLLVNCYLTGI